MRVGERAAFVERLVRVAELDLVRGAAVYFTVKAVDVTVYAL